MERPPSGTRLFKKKKNLKAHEMSLCLFVGPKRLRNHSPSLLFLGILYPSPFVASEPWDLGSIAWGVKIARPWVAWWPLPRVKKEFLLPTATVPPLLPSHF